MVPDTVLFHINSAYRALEAAALTDDAVAKENFLALFKRSVEGAAFTLHEVGSPVSNPFNDMAEVTLADPADYRDTLSRVFCGWVNVCAD